MQPIDRVVEIEGLVARDAPKEVVLTKLRELREALSTSKPTDSALGGLQIGKIIPGGGD